MTNEPTDTTPEHSSPLSTPKKPFSPHPPFRRDQAVWKRAFFILIAVVVLLGAVSAGAVGNQLLRGGTISGQSLSLGTGKDGNQTVTQTESDIASVVDKVTPSVVSVTTSIKARSYYGTTDEQAAGTGILVSSDGYVITNNHVIDGASTVSVFDSNGDEYDNVKVIGRDPLNDIAFLKIDANKTFTAAEIGDSSTVKIGQQVVAIGNALGQYQNTVTSGIISGTGRPVTATDDNGSNGESLVDLLQTDASINPGNSGGPLLNLAGQVIGINSAVADANGIGFSIPINSEKGVLAGVLKDGKIERGYIGVNYLSITPDIARQYNLSVNEGAYVYTDQGSAIQSGGPGDKAGIKDKDIIQKVNDQTVGEQGGLSTLMGEYKPGDTVSLTILRDGKTITVQATLGTYSSN
jgi:serine protease Do